ncbi:NYN domain-containing protein [bacterium]|nr:NYN domain-containing protein [bacterium]
MLTRISKFQRVGVFVDVQNMFYSAKYLWGAKLNFSKLMEKAVRGRQLIRAICYVIENPEIDQASFLEMLKGNGYEVKSKALRSRSDGSAKGDWDMGLAIDAISIAEKIDVAVLVSGDGDFSDLVYHLRSRGVLVEVISFLGSTNEDLINAVDFYFPIENDMLLPLKPGGTVRPALSVQRSKPNSDTSGT